MSPDQPRGPLDSLHEQLRSALDTHLASLSHQYEEALATARCEVAAEADQALTARVEAVHGEWAAKLDAEVAAIREEADRRLAAELLRAKIDAEQEWASKIESEVEAARSEAERRLLAESLKARMEAEQQAAESTARVRTELEQALAAERTKLADVESRIEEERQRANEELTVLRQRTEALDAQRKEVQAALDAQRSTAQSELQSERQRTAGELESLRRRLDALQEQVRKAEADVEAERRRAALESEEASREAASRLASVRDQTAAQIDELKRQAAEQLEEARREAREAAATSDRRRESPGFDGQLAAIRAIDSARTLSDVLDALLRHASTAASRGAMFLVNGDRLRSWKTVGFPQIEASPFESALTGAGLLAKAIQNGEPVVSGQGVPAPTFAAVPADRVGVAVPILVGGRTVAVLYADNAACKDAESPASWTAAVELLARHASTTLALLTALKTVQALGAAQPGNGEGDEQSARRYARLLLSEIKLYNEAAVRMGRERRDLLERLRPEIDRARRLYEERVPSLVGARGQYFQQELVQTLADGDPALLGNP